MPDEFRFAAPEEEPLFSTVAPSGRRVTCVDERTYERVVAALKFRLAELERACRQ